MADGHVRAILAPPTYLAEDALKVATGMCRELATELDQLLLGIASVGQTMVDHAPRVVISARSMTDLVTAIDRVAASTDSIPVLRSYVWETTFSLTGT